MRTTATLIITFLLSIHGCQPFCSRSYVESNRHVVLNAPQNVFTLSSSTSDIESMRAGEIKEELESYGVSTKTLLEKKEFVEALKKAREDGLKPKDATTSTTVDSSSSSSSSSSSASSTTKSNDNSTERSLSEEMEICTSMRVSELRDELAERGVSTRSFFEKYELVKALAEARLNGTKKKNASSDDSEGYAEYSNVEVLTADDAGPRKKSSEQQEQTQQPSPFGGGNPFGGAGGMGGMGGIGDLLKNMGMGGMGGNAGGSANPFAGGGNPMGGMGDAMGKAQEMMKNPKVMEIVMKAQSNPKIMKAVQECMSNPAAFSKYQNDPEVGEIINELKKYL